MGNFYEDIPPNIYDWILEQKMLWVATAPLSGSGHVNVSPKGGEYFGLIDNRTFWYQDLSGSGNETIAHLRENGRITIMFNAFTGPPRIVRLWGKGRVLERGTPAFTSFIATNDVATLPGTRSIIVVDVHQVGSSCGYSVPYYDFRDFRKTLNQFYEKKKQAFDSGKESESMERYWAYKNAYSMDGLPGMQAGIDALQTEPVTPIVKMIGPYAPLFPAGPRSLSLSKQLRYQTWRVAEMRVSLVWVLGALLLGLLLGSGMLGSGEVTEVLMRAREELSMRLGGGLRGLV